MMDLIDCSQMPSDVDFKVMLTFIEFYATLLGFINYKLYNSLNLKYPPMVGAVLYDHLLCGIRIIMIPVCQ